MNVRPDDGAPDDGAPIDARPEQPPRARIGAAMAAGLRAAWDRLGLVLAVSVTWTIVVSLPLSADRWLPRSAPPWLHLLVLALAPILAAVPTAGAFSIAHRIATHDEAFYAHLWLDGLELIGAALRLMLAQAAVAVVLLTAAAFYLQLRGWPGRLGVTLCCYALLVWAMMLVYQWPALVAQHRGLFDEPGHTARRGAAAAIRRSFYLALGRPFFAAALVAGLGVASLLLAATVVMPALLWLGTIALVSTVAFRALLVEFGILPAQVQNEPVPDEQFRLGPDMRRADGAQPGPQ
jgi:hypothetical protein